MTFVLVQNYFASFANGPCVGGNNRNGTCYTEAECGSRGGSSGGSCASGFGVCCISKGASNRALVRVQKYIASYVSVTLDCGETSSENCTYFESSSPTAGTCKVDICPCSDNICQVSQISWGWEVAELFHRLMTSSSAPPGLWQLCHHRPQHADRLGD